LLLSRDGVLAFLALVEGVPKGRGQVLRADIGLPRGSAPFDTFPLTIEWLWSFRSVR
jgi:hypothetical protein